MNDQLARSTWSPAITLRVYAHVVRQHAVGVAATFAAAMDAAGEASDTADKQSSQQKVLAR